MTIKDYFQIQKLICIFKFDFLTQYGYVFSDLIFKLKTYLYFQI